jgi:hypothetical protein
VLRLRIFRPSLKMDDDLGHVTDPPSDSGSWKVTCVTHLPSGGGWGIFKGRAHGEFAHARLSSQVSI